MVRGAPGAPIGAWASADVARSPLVVSTRTRAIERNRRTATACQRSPAAATMPFETRSTRLAGRLRGRRREGGPEVRVIRGVRGAIWGHPWMFLGVAAVVVAMSIVGPV